MNKKPFGSWKHSWPQKLIRFGSDYDRVAHSSSWRMSIWNTYSAIPKRLNPNDWRYVLCPSEQSAIEYEASTSAQNVAAFANSRESTHEHTNQRSLDSSSPHKQRVCWYFPSLRIESSHVSSRQVHKSCIVAGNMHAKHMWVWGSDCWPNGSNWQLLCLLLYEMRIRVIANVSSMSIVRLRSVC